MKKILFLAVAAVLLMQLGEIDVHAESVIVTDGYFDDWQSMPKASVGYNVQFPNYISLVMDDSYIYLYYETSSQYGSYIPLDAINLYIGSTNVQIFIRYPNSSGTTDWSKNVYNLPTGTYTGLAPFTNYPNNSLGEAVLVKSSINQLELKISIAALESNLSLPSGTISNGAPVSVNIPGLGTDTVMAVGVSSGPVLSVLLPVLFVLIIFLRRHFLNNRRNKQMKEEPVL